jgi:hypothetical protein
LASSGGTTPNITIQQASGSQSGFLSSTDWSTFNGKQNALTNPVTGTGVSGRVAYWNGTNSITSDAELLFDGSNLTLAGNLILANGANRIVRIGSLTNYNYDLQTVGEDFQIIEAGSTPRLTIKFPNGNVLIGTTTDNGAKLQISGTATFSSTITATGDIRSNGIFRDYQGEALIQTTTSAVTQIGSSAAGTSRSLAFFAGNSQRMTITTGGNVQVLSAGQLQVFRSDNTRSGLFYCNGLAAIVEASTDPLRMSTPDRLEFYSGNTERMRITTGGNFLIGTTTDYGVKLAIDGNIIMPQGTNREIYMGSASAYNYRIRVTGDDFIINEAGNAAKDRLKFVYADTRWYITGGLTISGSLSKGSGSFKIDHPLPEKKDTHHLVHSFIEGPQADNIYRGKIQLINGHAQVNIDHASGMSEGTFVLLNGNVQCFTSNESGWIAIKGKIEGNILNIEAENSNCTDIVSWLVIGERHDQHMIDTDWTNKNGKVIVEPLKN